MAGPSVMTTEEAQLLVRFANEHDDGSPQPRARYDAQRDAVVVACREFDVANRQSRTVYEEVRNMAALRAVLGY